MTKSPTLRLLLGLLITLAAVSGFSSYTLYQLRGLRLLQTNTIDLNRHDSLLLLRVESDLNRFGLGLRDMTRTSQTEDVSKYREEFQRLDTDLQESLDEEEKLTLSFRRRGQHAELIKALKQFWQNCDEVFSAANNGHAEAARRMPPPTSTRSRPIWRRWLPGCWCAITKPKSALTRKSPPFTKAWSGIFMHSWRRRFWPS
jgi:hypothetical protein